MFKIKIKINYFICNRSTTIYLYSITKTYDIEPGIVFLEGGNIGSIIIDYGEKNNFDFIVIGSRGQGKFKHALLGNVSYRVLHHSKNPVLIVK